MSADDGTNDDAPDDTPQGEERAGTARTGKPERAGFLLPGDDWTEQAMARGMPASIAVKLPHLPESPGVYLWKDEQGVVLYVGKAKRLRSRVRSYWAQDHLSSPKTRGLMRKTRDLETIVVPDEAHALILEATLIKEYHPRFNIALRDDKSYPYIKVTLPEPFPRVIVTRRLQDDGARYFGPYTDVGSMRRALNVVKRIFTVRSCHYALPGEAPDRPCLDYSIKRCQAPCVGFQSVTDYRAMIDEVVWFLEGRTSEVVRRVRERMMEAAEALDFERAGELRDALRHLEKMEEPTVVVEVEGGDRDVVGYARDGEDACVVVMRIRGGKLLSRDHRLVEHAEGEEDGAVLGAALSQWYRTADARAGALFVPFDFEDRETLEWSLEGTKVRVPQRGPRRALVDLADKNARHLLEEFKLAALEADERAADPVYELQRELGLPRLPRSFVTFDISHAQGTDVVASAVWFENARPKRSEYRKFKIMSFEGNDDFKAMNEVVTRYFARRQREDKPFPDLAVIDGGKGQLNAAREALEAIGVKGFSLISLAKREEEIFLPGRSDSVRLAKRSPALRMLQRARDEAHRFAVTFQRQKRAARTITSELLKIPKVGPSKRRALLHTFGSVQGVREASVEQIAALPGFGADSARHILRSLGVAVPESSVPVSTAESFGTVSQTTPEADLSHASHNASDSAAAAEPTLTDSPTDGDERDTHD